jgi:hypothetical protein
MTSELYECKKCNNCMICPYYIPTKQCYHCVVVKTNYKKNFQQQSNIRFPITIDKKYISSSGLIHLCSLCKRYHSRNIFCSEYFNKVNKTKSQANYNILIKEQYDFALKCYNILKRMLFSNVLNNLSNIINPLAYLLNNNYTYKNTDISQFLIAIYFKKYLFSIHPEHILDKLSIIYDDKSNILHFITMVLFQNKSNTITFREFIDLLIIEDKTRQRLLKLY